MRIPKIIAILFIGVLFILSACTLSTPKPAPTIVPVQGPYEVRVPGREFKPSIITVPVGTTVKWISYDGEQHSVTSDTGLFDGSLPPFGSFNYTFTERGNYEYYCQNHGHNGEVGVVVVK